MGQTGAKGDTGAAATVQVGNTNTGAPGTNAQVTNAGNEHFAVFNFTIPRGDKGEKGATGAQGAKGEKGDKGDTGAAATITVGSTTTTNPGTNATVTNSGTTSAAVLNFGIPRGATGSVKSDVVAELPETGEEDTFYLVNREATEQTATGKAISFTNNDNAGDITDFKLDGETSQNGTPTPDAPVPVQTTTGENVVQICGKNLLEYKSRFTPYSNYGLTTTMDATTGIITINGTFTGTSPKDIPLIANSVSINIFQNYSYYIGIKYISGSKTGDSNFTARTALSSGSYYWNNAVPLVHEDRSVLCNINNAVRFDTIRFFVPVGATFDNYKVLPYINANETGYEPYQGQSYTLSLGSLELCKIGDYQDYIYKNEGKWYVHKEVGKNVADGNTVWTKSQYGTNNYTFYPSPASASGENPSFGGRILVKSNCFEGIPYDDRTVARDNITYAANLITQDNRVIYVRNTPYSTVEELTTFCAANKPVFYYVLATPTDTEITNEALIAQLDNVASAPLYTGVNNITTITPNEQGTLEIKYVTYDKYNQNKVYIWNDTLQQWQIIVP
jgi:hypothetical protein